MRSSKDRSCCRGVSRCSPSRDCGPHLCDSGCAPCYFHGDFHGRSRSRDRYRGRGVRCGYRGGRPSFCYDGRRCRTARPSARELAITIAPVARSRAIVAAILAFDDTGEDGFGTSHEGDVKAFALPDLGTRERHLRLFSWDEAQERGTVRGRW